MKDFLVHFGHVHGALCGAPSGSLALSTSLKIVDCVDCLRAKVAEVEESQGAVHRAWLARFGEVTGSTLSGGAGKDDSPSVIGPPAPMPTAADLWKAQFCNHIVGMLTLDGQGWAVVPAQRAAEGEYAALAEYEGDPIESANACMSCWDCEPDFQSDARDVT